MRRTCLVPPLLALVLALPLAFTACAQNSSSTSGAAASSAGRAAASPSASLAPAPSAIPTSCTYGHGAQNALLPDPACTPGAADARVSASNTTQTICHSGYATSVRPPEQETETLKRALMRSYGVSGQPLSGYELDHLISLELGGAPDDVRNLWPQPASPEPGYHQKDQVENYLHRQVCAGAMSLATAQQGISTNWTQFLPRATAEPTSSDES